jgi:hypothetical protein
MFEDQKAIKTIFNNQRLQNKNPQIYILINQFFFFFLYHKNS